MWENQKILINKKKKKILINLPFKKKKKYLINKHLKNRLGQWLGIRNNNKMFNKSQKKNNLW